MPCKLCRKCGHNSRTCPNKLSSIKKGDEQKKKD